MKHLLKSLLTGALAAALEGLLIALADPAAGAGILLQSMLFWLSAGMVIYYTKTGLPIVLQSILIAYLLSLPWYVNLVVIPGQWDHLIPLIVSTGVFGLLIGLVVRKLKSF
ncbi:MAG: hypothetical protein K1X47_16290 [Cyclobacteriaceae bacterium]|nr:hypothetical protein [Cyclobacteriaceae bacterium]